jgi:hypothetical protein
MDSDQNRLEPSFAEELSKIRSVKDHLCSGGATGGQ